MSAKQLTGTVRISLKAREAQDLPGAFGPGCARLLEGVAELHSLNQAAKAMGMSYSKAWRIMNEAEAHLHTRLISRKGAHGSDLTPEGKRILAAYQSIEHELESLLLRRINELFSD